MDEAPTPLLITKKEKTTPKTILIAEKDDTKKLNIMIEKDYIIFKIEYQDPLLKKYSGKYSLNDIKLFHKMFSSILSFNEFLDYIIKLSKDKKISIQKEEEFLFLNLETEYLLTNYNIRIKLIKEELDVESNLINVFNQMKGLKNIIKKLKDEINEKNHDITKLTEENNNLKIEIKKGEEKLEKIQQDNNNIAEEIFKLKENLKKEINDLKENFNKEINDLKEMYNNDINNLENEIQIFKNEKEKDIKENPKEYIKVENEEKEKDEDDDNISIKEDDNNERMEEEKGDDNKNINSIDFDEENENNKDINEEYKKFNSFDNNIIMINKNDNYIINNNNYNIKEKEENQNEINRQQLIQNIKNDIIFNNNNIIPHQKMKRNYSNKYMAKSLQMLQIKENIPIKEINNKQIINSININSKMDNKNAEVITPQKPEIYNPQFKQNNNFLLKKENNKDIQLFENLLSRIINKENFIIDEENLEEFKKLSEDLIAQKISPATIIINFFNDNIFNKKNVNRQLLAKITKMQKEMVSFANNIEYQINSLDKKLETNNIKSKPYIKKDKILLMNLEKNLI